MIKRTLIALFLGQLILLTGCSDTQRLRDIVTSTREGPVAIDRIWDIHEPNRRLLLVMVHGYNSSSDQAWGGFPRIIKSEKDTAFSRFNVLRYGYGSAVCRNKVDISDRADGLNSFLSDELKHYDGMIIVGHSLGGLVAMGGLINLAKAHNAELGRILVALMTFGTPHLGVQGAERLGELGFLCTDKQAEAVKVFDRSLKELRVDWDSYFGSNDPKYRVTIKTFYGPEDFLVVPDNACGRFPGCEQVVDGENHVMIVKPSDTNHLAYIKLRVQVDSMTDLIYGANITKRSPLSYKEEEKLNSLNNTIPVPSTPIPEPKRLEKMAILLEKCGPSLSTKRPAAKFISYWVSLVNKMREDRNPHAYDLQNLMEVRSGAGIPRDSAGSDPIQEANFTLSCLGRIGYLRMEKFDPPSRYAFMAAVLTENLRIMFLKPLMTIPE